MSMGFNEAYWASKHPEVVALRAMPTCSLERIDKAFHLAQQGFVLDYEIDVVGLDPYQTMWLREQYGLVWTQKFPDPPNWNLPPGITGMPGIPFDPNNPPKDAIKTSTKESDYAPFAPPPVIEVPGVPATPWWERPLGIGKFAVRIGDSSPAGTKSGGYVKKSIIVFGGFVSTWWESVA